MPMSNSESRKRAAELAAGSGDETGCTKCPPGEHCDMRHGQLVAPTQPPAPDPSSDLTHPGDVSKIGPEPDTTPAPDPAARTCFHGGHSWGLPTPENEWRPNCTLCGDRKLVPAPDPDETCPKRVADREHLFSEREGRCIYCSTPAPPATTGPAGEAEGLAEIQRLIHMHYCGAGLDLPMPEHPYRPAEKCWAVAKVLAARDAAQQRIGAEKAWDEGYEAGANAERIAHDHNYYNGHPDPEESNPYRTGRIVGEGQT